MNPKAREAIIRAFDNRVLWMDAQLPEAVKQQSGINETDTFRTMHLMKDAGELVPEGSHGAIRLSLKVIESRAPQKERVKKYMVNNLLAIAALIISLLGVAVAFTALLKN